MTAMCSLEKLVAINQIILLQIKGDRNFYRLEILNPRTIIKFTYSALSVTTASAMMNLMTEKLNRV
jgi:hypothetical protein